MAEADLADAKYELMLAEGLAEKRVTSIEDRDTRRYAAQKAEATLAQARADSESALTDLERLTVRAPVDGQVLQLNVHLGEFAPTGVLQTPLGNEKSHPAVQFLHSRRYRAHLRVSNPELYNLNRFRADCARLQ